jgi:prepilin-type N-terminal cleavage/methylation domain-containing protein
VIQYFKPRSLKPQSQSGFTLIEILVIIIIVGILSAIAAPGWLAFINNRRVSTIRGQVADIVRKAQTEAKTKRRMQAVLFDKVSDPPRIAWVSCASISDDAETCDSTGAVDWQVLGNGDVKSGVVQYIQATKKIGTDPNQARLVFDSNGVVHRTSDRLSGSSLAVPFVIGFGITNPGAANSYGTPRCLVVETLIGGLREGNSKSECLE